MLVRTFLLLVGMSISTAPVEMSLGISLTELRLELRCLTQLFPRNGHGPRL